MKEFKPDSFCDFCGSPILAADRIQVRDLIFHEICFNIEFAAFCADLESRGELALAKDAATWAKIVVAQRSGSDRGEQRNRACGAG